MAQQDRPPRSLRSEGGPRYFRNWSAGSEAVETELPDQSADSASVSQHEMQMVDALDTPEAPRLAPVQQEMAPLKVIVPEASPPAVSEAPKPKVTRMEPSKLQRARRYSELQAEEQARKQEEEEAREQSARAIPPEQSAKTRSLAKTTAQTTELQSNLRDIEGKLDEAKENVKTTANALSENIRQVSERITVSVVSGIQKMSLGLNGLIQRMGGKNRTSSARQETDFDDAPLPSEQTPPAAQAPTAPTSLLERVPAVPPAQAAALFKEGVFFLTFDKQPLVKDHEKLSGPELQRVFVENALQDIRKCVKLVRELPDPKEGPYTGIPLAYIFKHVRDQDLFFFMHYVLSKPEPFRKKTFKLSEAFGTWILKRSQSTVVGEPFPEVPAVAYFPLYRDQIRFLTRERKQLVLASGKSPDEVEKQFIERALEDVRACVPLVEKFPPAKQGPYKERPLKQIFRSVRERDIYFFLHYVQAQPEVFRNQNFKFSEAFASWILKRSHETQLPQR